MDAIETYITVGAVVGAVLSAASAFFYRDKTKAELDFYQRNNAELRSSNTDLREEKTDLEKSLAETSARCEEKENMVKQLKELNSKQPDFASLSKLISSNHTSLTKQLSQNHKEIITGLEQK
jgi:gas vesicle protein